MRIFTLLFFSLFTLLAFSQTNVDVATGDGYANEVYYSFENGSVETSARDNWDIAFASERMDVSILANNGAGVEVYTYPNGDITAWDDIDTSGMYMWTPMYNSVESMNDGAFLRNMDLDNAFDQGWGVYNMITHVIEGDSLYVIKTVSGEYKKLWIVGANPNQGFNTWEFKYADLNGGSEETITLNADDYADYNYIHYSISSNVVVDKEPVSTAWDLLFTRYFDYTIPYYVTGVQINSTYVQVQQVDGVDQGAYENYTESNFTTNWTEIGSDWKEFDMGSFTYVVNDQRVYFTKIMNEAGTDSTYWKLYFTGFSGSTEGKYSFTQKNVTDNTAIRELEGVKLFEVYPNPSTNFISLVTDSKMELQVIITDISGKLVYENQVGQGFNKKQIAVDQLPAGVYNVSITSENGISSQKFIKQ